MHVWCIEPRGGGKVLRVPDGSPPPDAVLDREDTAQVDAIAAIVAKRQAGQPYTGSDRDAVLDWLLGVRR